MSSRYNAHNATLLLLAIPRMNTHRVHNGLMIAANDRTLNFTMLDWSQIYSILQLSCFAIYTGKNDLTRRVTHREAVCGPVIHSIFDAWHYERPMDLHVD
jgi:hypothetical protein